MQSHFLPCDPKLYLSWSFSVCMYLCVYMCDALGIGVILCDSMPRTTPQQPTLSISMLT